MTHNDIADSVVEGLVREYLSRKGLKRTLAEMDAEFPRSPQSIGSRSELVKILHMERLYKKHKEKEKSTNSTPKTLIELVVTHWIDLDPKHTGGSKTEKEKESRKPSTKSTLGPAPLKQATAKSEKEKEKEVERQQEQVPAVVSQQLLLQKEEEKEEEEEKKQKEAKEAKELSF